MHELQSFCCSVPLATVQTKESFTPWVKQASWIFPCPIPVAFTNNLLILVSRNLKDSQFLHLAALSSLRLTQPTSTSLCHPGSSRNQPGLSQPRYEPHKRSAWPLVPSIQRTAILPDFISQVFRLFSKFPLKSDIFHGI